MRIPLFFVGIVAILLFAACFPEEPSTTTGERYLTPVFSGYKVTKEVVYGRNAPLDGNMQDLKMDIYEPTGDSLTQRPVFIIAHGGFFMGGDKDDFRQACIDLAKLGFVAVTIEYRLWGGGLPIDTHQLASIAFRGTADMKAAVRFLRKDAATNNDYQINPNRIIVGGFSAGATMALLTAYADLDDPFFPYIKDTIRANGGITGNSGNAGYSSEVMLAVNLAGSIYDERIINNGEPPLFSHHGDADPVAPYEAGYITYSNGTQSELPVVGAARLHERLDDLGIANRLYTLENGGHAGSLDDKAAEALFDFIYPYVVD